MHPAPHKPRASSQQISRVARREKRKEQGDIKPEPTRSPQYSYPPRHRSVAKVLSAPPGSAAWGPGLPHDYPEDKDPRELDHASQYGPCCRSKVWRTLRLRSLPSRPGERALIRECPETSISRKRGVFPAESVLIGVHRADRIRTVSALSVAKQSRPMDQDCLGAVSRRAKPADGSGPFRRCSRRTRPADRSLPASPAADDASPGRPCWNYLGIARARGSLGMTVPDHH